MSISSIRNYPNGTYEKLRISLKKENNSFLTSFTYIDTSCGFQYTSNLFIQNNEWAAVKIAIIHAEKYLKENKVKDCYYFSQNIWEKFFSSKQPELQGLEL